MPKRIVASGYFDPLHEGHVEYLELARALGDELVVIVNNDAQAMLKSGRVLLPESARLRIVGALRCVDKAVMSIDNDATVCRTLAQLKPDVFAKGGDRHAGEIPEAGVCRELGIRIEDGLGMKKDHSSRIRSRLSGIATVGPEERLVVQKVWGSEKWVANNDRYCGKFLKINAGMHTSWHMHIEKDEVIYVRSGVLTLLHRPVGANGADRHESVELREADAVRIFPGTRHRLCAMDGDVELIEFSTRHVEQDTVREGEKGW